LNEGTNAAPGDGSAWGIWSRYTDGLGRSIAVGPEVIAKVRDAAAHPGSAQHPMATRRTFVLRAGDNRIEHFDARGVASSWQICADGNSVATAMVEAGALVVPDGVPLGIYQIRPVDASECAHEAPSANLIVAPDQTCQGPAEGTLRTWLMAVQLYGVRSRSNWGHGDFTDLAALLDCAAGCGAGGIGLNPLHILFDDRPGHISPYSPNSRRFLDPLYIDAQQIAEFPGIASLNLDGEVARLRASKQVDYAGVRSAKRRALLACHAAFRDGADPARRLDFDAFRAESGGALRRFACFEVLRRRFNEPWWLWPSPWRAPGDDDLQRLSVESAQEVEFHEYLQWIADRQLGACRMKAQSLGLPVGLYIDLAVGVAPDGADAWSNQTTMLKGVSIGAPPDRINLHGQNWGLTTFSPAGLTADGFEPFRLMLAAAMRHAGAIRIDHVLGLNRLFVIPDGMSGNDGTYLDFPIDALLAVTATQSSRNRCVVIGEDLGTVPEDFRARLNRWGLWTYRVMQFERDWEGRFHPPQSYPEKSLASFNTHDLPTFAGWWTGHDLSVRHDINLDPGETPAERERGRGALREALSRESPWADGDFVAVASYLAAASSRIVCIPLEDILGSIDQPNVPGTVDQYPNWRLRSAEMVEDLASNERLANIAMAMRRAGRSRQGR
jgi:4-alpha-glucanotransferase